MLYGDMVFLFTNAVIKLCSMDFYTSGLSPAILIKREVKWQYHLGGRTEILKSDFLVFEKPDLSGGALCSADSAQTPALCVAL